MGDLVGLDCLDRALGLWRDEDAGKGNCHVGGCPTLPKAFLDL